MLAVELPVEATCGIDTKTLLGSLGPFPVSVSAAGAAVVSVAAACAGDGDDATGEYPISGRGHFSARAALRESWRMLREVPVCSVLWGRP